MENLSRFSFLARRVVGRRMKKRDIRDPEKHNSSSWMRWKRRGLEREYYRLFLPRGENFSSSRKNLDGYSFLPFFASAWFSIMQMTTCSARTSFSLATESRMTPLITVDVHAKNHFSLPSRFLLLFCSRSSEHRTRKVARKNLEKKGWIYSKTRFVEWNGSLEWIFNSIPSSS